MSVYDVLIDEIGPGRTKFEGEWSNPVLVIFKIHNIGATDPYNQS